MSDYIRVGYLVEVDAPGQPDNRRVGRVVARAGIRADVMGDGDVVFTAALDELVRVHRCGACGRVSHHPDDVANAYCVLCGHFCDDADEVPG